MCEKGVTKKRNTSLKRGSKCSTKSLTSCQYRLLSYSRHMVAFCLSRSLLHNNIMELKSMCLRVILRSFLRIEYYHWMACGLSGANQEPGLVNQCLWATFQGRIFITVYYFIDDIKIFDIVFLQPYHFMTPPSISTDSVKPIIWLIFSRWNIKFVIPIFSLSMLCKKYVTSFRHLTNLLVN